MDYNKLTPRRLLSICDARYTLYLLPQEQYMNIVISKARAVGPAAA